MNTKKLNPKKLVKVLSAAITQLMILRGAWLIGEDDNRKTKALYISPRSVREWTRIINLNKKAMGWSKPHAK